MKNCLPKMCTRSLLTLSLGFFSFIANAENLAIASNQSGTIKLVNQSGVEKLTYTSTELMYIKLTDSDRNQNALTAETLTVLVTSITEPLGESVTLTETGINTGIFSGSLAFNLSTTPTANAKLDVRKGEKVIVKYSDPADDFGNQVDITAKVYFDVTILTGTIVENMTKAKSPYLLTGDVIIPQGYSINVEAGTEVRFMPLKDDKSSGSDVNRIEIIVNGKFSVNGTATDSVRFMSNSDSPAVGDWYGIRYESFNTSSIKYAVMQHATQLISYRNVSVNSDTIRVQHCRIINDGSAIKITEVNNVSFDISHNYYNCSGRFLNNESSASGSDLFMHDNYFISNSDIAYTSYFKKIELKKNRVIGSGFFLYSRYTTGDILLQDNDFQSPTISNMMAGSLFFNDEGYSNSNRSVVVKNNRIKNGGSFISTNYWSTALKQFDISGNDVFAQNGINVSMVSSVNIKNNRLYLTNQADSTATANAGYNNGTGCSMNSVSSAIISDNIFNARGFDGHGISLNQTNAVVKKNTIKGFDIGIYSNSSFENPAMDSVQYNTITYNFSKGVQLEGYTRMPFNYNNIYNNYDTLSYNQNSSQYFSSSDFYCNTGSTGTVDARFNYWGKANSTQMAAGANPKNITRIYDQQDNPLMSFVNYAQWLDRLNGTPSAPNQTGIVQLVNSSGTEAMTYASTENLKIKLTDSDRNKNALTADTLTVLVTSITEPLGESVTLTETGINTGIFSGSLAFNLSTTPTANAKLDVRKGEKVIVKYSDPADDFGNQVDITAKVYFDVTILTGTIVENMTKAKSPYLLTGDVIIPQGYSINVEAGTEVRFMPLKDDKSSGSDVNRIEIIVNGKFSVNGTATDSVRFMSNSDSPAVGDWYGIRYESFNTSSIKYAVMQHATQLISYRNVSVNSDTIRVQHCRIINDGSAIKITEVNNVSFDISHNYYNCSGRFLNNESSASGSDLFMHDNYFISNSDIAYTSYFKKIELKKNRVIGSGFFLYSRYTTGDILLQDNDFQSPTISNMMAGSLFFNDEGYSNSNRSVVVKNNRIKNGGSFISTNYWSTALKQFDISGNDVFAQNGINVSMVSSVNIKNNRLYLTNQADSTATANAGYNNGTGCSMNSVSSAIISDNIFNARGFDGHGISLNQTNAVVKKNTIKGFDIGIYSNSSFENPAMDSVQYNTITYNYTRGVQLDGYTRMPFNYNNIYNNYDTLNYNQNSSQYFSTSDFYCNTGSTGTVDARFNYWGRANSTQMTSGANPKNITRIYDQQDNPLMSFVNYAQWLDRPFGMKGIKLLATQNDICEGKSVTLSLVSVAADDQQYVITQNDGGSTVVWSTGETVASRVISPTKTTTYSVTYNNETGTYRDSITILVGVIAAPTGDTLQYVTNGSKLSTVRVVGSAIRWYDAANGSNLVDTTKLVVNGTIYYASQQIGSCESVRRLAVKVLIGDPFALPYSGSGIDNMTFSIYDAKIKGELLQSEDVIAIYCGNICTGKTRLSSILPTTQPYLSVSSSKAETGLNNGYTEDSEIRVKIWDASASKAFNAIVDFYVGSQKIDPMTFTPNTQAYIKIRTADLQGFTLDNDTVKESQPVNTFITRIRPVVFDKYEKYTFALANGTTANNNNLFTLKGDSLLTNTSFDFEQIDSMKINLKVTNSLLESITKERIIKIKNVNESPFNVVLTTTNVDENTPVNKLVSRIKASDYDKADSHTFALVAGDGDVQNSYFQIKGDSLLTAKKILFSIGSTYSIRIKATDKGGLNISKKLLININDSSMIILPQKPANVKSVLAGYTKVDLTWDKNPELKLSGYNLYRSEKDSSLRLIKSLIQTTSYRDSIGLKLNTLYRYEVSALDSVGKESRRSYLYIKTGDNQKPDTVRNLVAKSIANAIELTWSKNTESDIWKYKVYRGISTEALSFYKEVDNKQNSFVDNTLTAEVWYFYKVTAVDSVGVSETWDKSYEGVGSNMVYAKTKDQVAPNVPTLVVAELYGFNKVKLSWKANAEKDLFGYKVYRQEGAAQPMLIGETKSLNLKDSVLKYQTPYYYQVSAIDTSGNEGLKTDVSILTGDALAPDSVRNLTTTSSPDVIILNWSPSANADVWKYRLYKGLAENAMTLLQEIQKGTNYYYDFSVVLGKRYFYAISAVDSAGLNVTWDPANEGPRSKVVSALAKDIVGPGKPTISTSTSSNKKVTFTWGKLTDSDLDKYRIYRGLSSDKMTQLDSVAKTVNTYKDLTVRNDVTYYYSVCGVDTSKNEGEHSKILVGTPVNVKPIIAEFSDITKHDIATPNCALPLNLGESIDVDGTIDSVYWQMNDVIVSRIMTPTINFSQGSSHVKVIIMDNDGGKDSAEFNVHVDSRFRLFTDANTGNAGISTIGNNYIFLPLKDGKMQILNNDFVNKFDVSVGGEIGSVSSISTDTVMYLASSNKSVYSFNRQGLTNWELPIGGTMQATPTIDNTRNLIYVGVSNNNIFAIDRLTGKQKWFYRTASPINQPGIIKGTNLLLILTDAGAVHAFDLDGQIVDNELKPKYTLELGCSVKSAPAIDANGYLFIATTDGKLVQFVFRAVGGIKTGEIATDGSFFVSPVIGYDGTVYVGSADSTLYAFDGSVYPLELKWTKKFNAPISTTATINENGMVYIGTQNGTMYALSETGETIWSFKANSKIGNATSYVNGNILFSTETGGLYRIYDGWRFQAPVSAPRLRSASTTAAVSKAPQWGTYQGNNRRSGVQSESMATDIPDNAFFSNENDVNTSIYPNPFDQFTSIGYEVKEPSKVTIRVLDATGRLMEMLDLGKKDTGKHIYLFDGKKLDSGLYFYQIHIGKDNASVKMIKK